MENIGYSQKAVNYRFLQDSNYRRLEIINLNICTKPKPKLKDETPLEERLSKAYIKEDVEILSFGEYLQRLIPKFKK